MISADYLTLPRSFEDHIAKMPPNALKVLLVLINQVQRAQIKTPLSINSLMGLTDLSSYDVRAALLWLENPSFVNKLAINHSPEPYITIKRTTTNKSIHVAVHQAWSLTDRDVKVILTEEAHETDERITELELENKRLEQAWKGSLKDRSQLLNALRGDERVLASEITAYFGRALMEQEAYYLGQMIQAYGPERVRKAFHMKKQAKDPLRAAYAMLNNAAQGKAADKKDVTFEKPVTYREL